MYTRRLSVMSLALVVLCLSAASAVKADEIALWNFNDSNILVDRGAGTLTTTANPANVGFSTGLTGNAQMGDPAGSSLSITNNVNNGSFVRFNVSTVGFTSIVVSFASNRNLTGFNSVTFQWSNNGTTFNSLHIFDPEVEPGEFGLTVAFLPAAGVANNPLFAIRFILNGASDSAGLIRFDNVLVAGTPTAAAIPEPTTLLLLGTGLIGVAGAVRRRRTKI